MNLIYICIYSSLLSQNFSPYLLNDPRSKILFHYQKSPLQLNKYGISFFKNSMKYIVIYIFCKTF